MKVWSDFSTIVKLVMICLLVGFVAGFCSSVASNSEPGTPAPATSPSASVTETSVAVR